MRRFGSTRVNSIDPLPSLLLSQLHLAPMPKGGPEYTMRICGSRRVQTLQSLQRRLPTTRPYTRSGGAAMWIVRRRSRGGARALGPGALVGKEPLGRIEDDQRAQRDARGEAGLPQRVQVTPLHRARLGLLRMDRRAALARAARDHRAGPSPGALRG